MVIKLLRLLIVMVPALRIIESKDSKGRPKKTSFYLRKDNKLLKNVTTSAAGTYTSEYSYGRNGKCTSKKVHLQSS